MNEQEKKDYISNLLDDPSAADLNEAGKDLLRKMKEARDEGNHALSMINGLQTEIPKLQAQAENRQGRFDVLSDILIEEEDNRQLKTAADAALAEETAKKEVYPEEEVAGDKPATEPAPEVLDPLPSAPLPKPDVLDSLDDITDGIPMASTGTDD